MRESKSKRGARERFDIIPNQEPQALHPTQILEVVRALPRAAVVVLGELGVGGELSTKQTLRLGLTGEDGGGRPSKAVRGRQGQAA